MPVRSESEIFSDLERLCGEPGYIHVFSSLVVKNTFVFYGDAITGKNFENTFGDDRLIRTGDNCGDSIPITRREPDPFQGDELAL